MATFHSCELARPLVSELQAETNGVEVHLRDGEIWRLPRGLLSRSLLLRKLAEWNEDRECFVVRPKCQNTLWSLRVALDWPRSPAEVTEWRQACDFLLVNPTDSELAFAVTSALDVWLADASKVLVDCAAPEVLQLSRRLADYGCLEEFLRSPELARTGGYDGEYADAPKVAREKARPAELLQALSKSLRCEAAESGLAVLDFLPRLRQAYDSAPLKLHGALESTERTLLALTNTVHGSLRLLESAALLNATFGYKTMRHLVHRCLCCLYLTESRGETELCAVSIESCHSLQRLYYEDITLDLASLLPIKDQAAFLLPGLLGAREVLRLEPSASSVFAAACGKVPWLQAAMAGPMTLHLTGSFLCWCRSKEQPEGRPPPPGDVDLFCAAQQDLDAATAHVRDCMLHFAQSLWASAHVETSAPNAHRRKLHIRFGQQLPDLARRGLELLPKYALQCDVYVNSLAKVMQYHLPQVRCALYLRDRLPELFMTPSAAIAWIAMLNVDYCAIMGAKTPLEIICKSWLWGFNICLSQQEARIVLGYLRASHPVHCMEAEMLRRPAHISPHRGAHGFPWQPFMSSEEMSVEP
jgi:hypothetical protein